jgi:hypothetical protein
MGQVCEIFHYPAYNLDREETACNHNLHNNRAAN